jgi:long-chain acyl-CoA synthetase
MNSVQGLNFDHIRNAKNLADLVRSSGELFSKRPAATLVLANGMNGNLSYSQLDTMSEHFAIYLREELKLPTGQSVAIQMPNCLSYPIVALGIIKAGLILVNVNPLYTEKEMIHQLNDSNAAALITVDLFQDKATAMLSTTSVKTVIVASLPEFMPLLPKKIAQLVLKYWNKQIPKINEPIQKLTSALKLGEKFKNENSIDTKKYTRHVDLNSVALLQYTGGTTGVSKAAVLTHNNLLSNMNQVLTLLDKRLVAGEEVVLTALPLYHIFAFTLNFLSFHAIGARNILCPNPRPISNLQRAMENYKVSIISGVNTLFNALNNEDWFKETPPPSLKIAVAGGMALQGAVAAEFKKITGVYVIEGYGLTETSPVVAFNPFDKPKDGSIGLPIPETQIKLVDADGKIVKTGEPGELLVKGPQLMQGYWNKPEETEKAIKDGWFYTGDIATQDEDGYYKIVDRKKDMILVSGFNVFPNEVEDVLVQHPLILEVAVIGIPDGAQGEAVKAFIVLKTGENVTRPNDEDLKQFCKKSLVAYKVPKFFEFRADLPKTPVGKILRKELRAQETTNSVRS